MAERPGDTARPDGAAARSRTRFLPPSLRRRAAIGAVGGAAGGLILGATLSQGWVMAGLGVVVGAGFAAAVRPTRAAYLDTTVSAAALGVPAWALSSVILLPLLAGDQPQWTAEGMRGVFPALAGWLVYGIVMGFLVQALSDLVARVAGPESEPERPPRPEPTRVLILGGGFAGVSTAAELERLFGPDPAIAITLVSDTNALLFTPMLAEVAASSLEATHISTPLRTTLRRTAVVRGRVAALDLDRREVAIATGSASVPAAAASGTVTLGYDHLVLALGSVSNYFGADRIAAVALDFKALGDAIRIRNHVIDLFERAESERDPARRRELLTFVVAGGGFAGVELAGGLNDFARGMLAYYPAIAASDLQIVLVHSRERILPELSERLAGYALERMQARGVTFRLRTRVKDARPGAVLLDPPDELPTRTLVWTAGTAPSPLVRQLPVECDKRGAVLVDATLAVPGRPGVWALGDCALVPDVRTGKTCPPTAQFALRQARRLARNIRRATRGEAPEPFRFDALGALCVIGHQTACAEIRGLRFSGLFAWLLWRAVYLAKLPGLERKVRVLVDWTIELFFPRDIVQTLDVTAPDRSQP
ncbi:MAG TPA: NAD(P)/FAD-dependent oxidoreductase [Thermoanaerobaculaceae bacterium]|nr:NAD(P)/FAD-dependent oxidoreductase [Thermoanaerobaculaceae bacterium]